MQNVLDSSLISNNRALDNRALDNIVTDGIEFIEKKYAIFTAMTMYILYYFHVIIQIQFRYTFIRFRG